MADNANKIGHRNYALIDETSLTVEEKAAVEEAKNFKGYVDVVPFSYVIRENETWSIKYHRVFFTQGYTVVLDESKRLRFIQKGWMTCDEVSLVNKGNTTENLRNIYLKMIYEVLWL